jgi:predicted adenine nucleotide alpha hydrolase (AANH) superfamily ATPase
MTKVTIPAEILEGRPEIELEVPENETKILLHSCCAPCSGEVIEAMVKSGLDLTIYFYNPNIHPLKEYEIRKNENKRYADKLNIEFIDADYDVQNWFTKAKGMEYEPERGKRCTMCFDMRFVKSADYAKFNGFKVFTSSLGISRWKNMDQINDCGLRAAELIGDVKYWTYNWRKEGGGARMYDIAKRENFYKQEYCGCIYSLRDTNEWREKNGRDKIKIGEEFYEQKLNEYND